MYEVFFNLREEPFGMTPNPRFLFMSRKHEEALASLSYGIQRRKGFILITGEIGTGKTTLCRAILRNLKDTDTSLILNPAITEGGLLTAIIEDFGIKAGRSIRSKVDALNRFLLERKKAGRNAVVIIDESQHLSSEALEMVRLLSNLETESEKLLQIVFMGQPELRDKLKSWELRQLNQRITVRYHLNPLDINETYQYILHRLKVAGTDETDLRFTDGAVNKLFRYTGGYPREINTLCDRVLTAAYVENKKVVDKEMVLMAIKDIKGNEPSMRSARRLLRIFDIFRRRGVA